MGYAAYRVIYVVKAVWWTWKFADFLLKESSVMDVPNWLLKNPPTFTPIVKFFMSAHQTEAMKDYSNEQQRSRTDPKCDQELAEFQYVTVALLWNQTVTC